MSMIRKIRLAAVLFGLLAVLAMATVVAAQTSNGTLVGAVTDQTGAVVPNVDVKALSPQFGEVHSATTDSVGTYRIDGLQPGVYSVTFTASGLAALRVGGVVISGSVTTTANGVLQLGSIQSTVTVEAGAAQVIDTQSGQMAGTISQTEVASLPYGSFNPAELAMTLPGVQDVSPAAQIFEGVAYSVNGTRPHANNFLIDSVDDNDYGISGQAYQPDNVGAIQEVTILTDSYPAEYGRGGGSVLNYIYKTGSNSFHGQVWEINQNSFFAANPSENKVLGLPNPFFNENTYGFDVGGPVVKDKLFFFASAQWDPTAQRATGDTLRIPTAAGITTLKGLDNTNANLFISSLGGLVAPASDGKCLPLGPTPGTTVDRGCVDTGLFAQNGVPVAGTDTSQYYRVDYHPGPNDSISAGYIRNSGALSPDFFANPGALPPFVTEQGGVSQVFHAQWVHTVSTNIVNEFRYSYTNISFAFAQTPGTLAGPLANLPNLVFDADLTTAGPVGTTLELGVDSGFPQGRSHKTSQVQEALTFNHGRHTFKGGIDITYINVVDQIPFDSRGSIQYKQGGNFTDATTTGFYSSLANFIDDFTGPSGSINKVFGSPKVTPSVTMYMPYIQDTFRARDNLTFTLGLRYEYWGTVANVLQFPATDIGLGFGLIGATFPNMYAFPQRPDRNNFAPRLGFAYTPKWGGRWLGHGATVIRGGYGIYYDGLYTNIPDNVAASVPNANGGTIEGGPSLAARGQANALEQLNNVVAALDPLAATETITNKLVNPYTQQWNLNVQRELPGKFILTTAYVGSRGLKLFAPQDYNGAVGQDPVTGAYIRINPNFNEIVVTTNAGSSWYNAGEVELERSLRADFVLRASYTYSHFEDDVSEPIALITGGSSFSQVLDSQKSDWGNSAYDRRHRFVFSYVWSLPYNKSNWLLKALTDRWQWSQITTFDSGNPNTIYDGIDLNQDGHSRNDRPSYGNRKAPLDTFGIDGALVGAPGLTFDYLCILSGASCSPEPASSFHFIVPASIIGNVPRNSIFGPGQIYSDQSIERRFNLPLGKPENQTLTFRAEFFNAFNHPNFFTPNYQMNGDFNDVASTIAGGRSIKFWLRYEF
jgi:hypothetical protein